MARKKAAVADNGALLEIPVSYGKVSFGDKTASVSVSVSRGNIKDANKADQSLCGRRLTGKLMHKPHGWKGDQQALPGTSDDTEITLIFDVASLSLTSRSIGFTLSVSRDRLNEAIFTSFAKCEGRISITAIADMNDEEEGGSGDDED